MRRILAAMALAKMPLAAAADGGPSFDGSNIDETIPVPDGAACLGNENGGGFVILAQNDLIADGRIPPAFALAIHGAISPPGGPYGILREGFPSCFGLAHWVHPSVGYDGALPYAHPATDWILARPDGNRRARANAGVLHVGTVPAKDGPGNLRIGVIRPITLPDAPAPRP